MTAAAEQAVITGMLGAVGSREGMCVHPLKWPGMAAPAAKAKFNRARRRVIALLLDTRTAKKWATPLRRPTRARPPTRLHATI